MGRFVFAFGDDIGGAEAKDLLGGKGAGLAEMTRLGIPVPPGFTISTQACRHFQQHGKIPDGLREEVDAALTKLENELGKKLGDSENPLLVSVRSGARSSMPGMMDTILNLGLNETTAEGLAATSGDRRFTFDAYRRFVEMYANVVLGIDRSHFEHALGSLKQALGDPSMPDHEVPAAQLEELVLRSRRIVAENDRSFPDDVRAQLWGAIEAVFASWNNPRAIRYRRMHEIPDDLGTAVNVQAMVFGNMGDDSASGVAFTRNPSTGDAHLYGEYLPNAQGEDVVAGTRTPRALTVRASTPGREDQSLERAMPEAFAEIARIAARLEAHFRDVQDIEFTIEKSTVYLLQTRNGKRTAQAAVKVAVDMANAGVLTHDEAIMRVAPESLDQLLHATLPEPEVLAKRGVRPLASGLPASPGAAMGQIVLSADDAERRAGEGVHVILVRRETSPEDIHGMKAAEGIVTATGGMTSHAAVVARGLGRCCVAGVGAMNVDYETKKVVIRTEAGVVTLSEGDVITLDGTHGFIYAGELDVEAAAVVPELEALMSWADERRRLRIRTNADTPRAARIARSYGAEGIGLCRTEHMFFADDRLEAVRCMVLAGTAEERVKWIGVIEPMQRGDFEEMFEAMSGLPVTIRLLDWPLHEFLPNTDRDFESIAAALGSDVATVKRRAAELHEVNPMLGHRGVRLGLTMPEVYRMQMRAIVEAAVACAGRGVDVKPEIMIPVVALGPELAAMRDEVGVVVDEITTRTGRALDIAVGTMIELPRACLVAGELAGVAEFFSFGTNDLTQTTFGISRDDSAHFLPAYLADSRGLLEVDPFVRLDASGVGELVRIASERGRAVRPALKLGLCGEHGGDPRSIAFCHTIGLDYVSCSPPRLPIARLAAAQAAISGK